jgi:protein-disulfide isomerase/uncharacterized membrane protein
MSKKKGKNTQPPAANAAPPVSAPERDASPPSGAPALASSDPPAAAAEPAVVTPSPVLPGIVALVAASQLVAPVTQGYVQGGVTLVSIVAVAWGAQAFIPRQFVAAILAIIGIGVGVYMSWHHEVQAYGGEQVELVGCAEAEGVSCDIVNTSEWSEIFGVPQFTWGIPAYAAFLFVWLVARGQPGARKAALALGAGAFAYSLFLGYISVVELKYICLWCVRLYGINLALTVLAWLDGAMDDELPQGPLLGRLAGATALTAVLAIGGQKAYRASLLGDSPAIAQLSEADDGGAVKADPTGPAPIVSFQVRTEDGKDATLTTHENDAWKGNKDAKVAIVEYADLECGYCKRMSAQLKRLVAAYEDRIVFVFKHFPMNPTCNPGVKNPKHRDACAAALGSLCAKEQGKFWAFHDLAYKNQHQLDPASLKSYAEKVGVDAAKWSACYDERRYVDQIKRDGEAGASIDIHGTPRIFINGQLYRAGTSAEQMARAIEIALGADPAAASQAAQAVGEERDGAPVQPIPADVPPMRKISFGDLNFEIDTFESGLENGAATVGKHQIPGTNMSWYAAKEACEAAGKRLCSEEEWIAACQGARPKDDNGNGQFADDFIEGTAYPYSDYHEPERCWEDKNRDQFRPVYTGEMPGCVTPQGVYDMTGNMEEWVGATADKAILLGGAYDTETDHARCYRRNDTFGAGYANQRTGFRCCR